MRPGGARLLPLVLGLALLGLAFSAIGRAAHAQQWTADASVGRWLYDTPISATGESSLTFGVGYRAVSRWHRLAAGFPLTENEPLWGWVGSGGSLTTSAGPVRPGVDASFGGFVYRLRLEQDENDSGDDVSPYVVGRGATVEVLPGVMIPVGAAVDLSGRAGVVGYYGVEEDFTWSRTGVRTDFGVTYVPVPALTVAGEARFLGLDDRRHSYNEVSGAFYRSGRGIHAAVGRWWSQDVGATAWSLGGSVAAGSTTEIWGSVAREATNPLYQNPPRTNWAIGITVLLGSSRPARGPDAPYVEGGTVEIRLPDGYAAPTIAGDFSDWEPLEMVRSEEGWSVELDLTPGVYRYAFQSADGDWFVPEGVPGRTDDGMGGHVAVLIVR